MPPATILSQDGRQFRLETPLGKDQLVLVKWKGEERVSSLFHFEIEALGVNSDIKPSDLLMKAVNIVIVLPEGGERTISGIVSRFSRGGTNTEGHTWYRLHIVPPHFVLSLGEGYDPFQEKTTKEILTEVLGPTKFEFQLTKAYKPRAYCFKYQENDWNFISRLLEQEGIWYSFKHAHDSVTMVMNDGMANIPAAGAGTVPFTVDKDMKGQSVDTLSLEWTIHETGTLLRTHSEYAVGMALKQEENSSTGPGGWSASSPIKQYIFDQQLTGHRTGTTPGGGDRPADPKDLVGEVTRYARIRQEEAESTEKRVLGSGTVRSFAAGSKVKVTNHPEKSFNLEYFITTVRHRGQNGDYIADDKAGDAYENEFEAMPITIPYRPPRVAEWPRAQSTHLAVVTGPDGQEIFPDKFGRVRVDFRWNSDNAIKTDRGAWLRIAQPFAGPTFGAIFLPRIGHEVLVAFLDGNPDNPVIIGSLYSDVNMPPYVLPDNRTQSGIKTRSSLKGTPDEFNELRFEDKKGSEHINVQAQKDLMTLVKNNETRNVNNNRTTVIHNADHKTVEEKDDTVIVKKGDQLNDVEKGKRTVHVGGDQITNIDGQRTTTIKKDDTLKITGDHTITVDGKQTTKVRGDISTKADMGNISVNAALGNIAVKASVGKIEIEALQSIELKVGPSSIKLDMSGVTIKGLMISIEGTAMAKLKAPMTMVNGDGMLMMKGGITMIN